MDLTVSQLNLLIETIGERRKKDSVSQAMLQRLAILAAMSKEGAEVLQQIVNDTFMESKIIVITTAELSKFGLGKGK